MEPTYILGIDFGTTSVKVCLVHEQTGKCEATKRKESVAVIDSDYGPEGNKQHVPRVLGSLSRCLSQMKKKHLAAVTKIAVCGQMHGCLMWKYNPDSKLSLDAEARVELNPDEIGNMYTWLDGRCDSKFLASLPTPDSHIPIASGYGCATLIWLARERPDEVAKYDCSGTIQDLFVAMVCDLKKPVMTNQNAASWGYFNTATKEWNQNKLEECGFPMSLLPDIVDVGAVAGTLQCKLYGVPKDIPVYAAMGDLQCSVFPLISARCDAAINISTSAQVSYLLPKGFEPSSSPPETTQTIQEVPFFGDEYLAVAASLNGGNALKEFVIMFQEWMTPFALTGSKKAPPREDIWKKLVELADHESQCSDLVVVPTIFGERASPELCGSITNIKARNTSLGKFFRALCKGLIVNLHGMCSSAMLIDSGIERVNASGSALLFNTALQKELKSTYSQFDIQFKKDCDAAYGAAAAVLHNFDRTLSSDVKKSKC